MPAFVQCIGARSPTDWNTTQMRITKLLSLDSAPAQAIVDRAKAISLTMAQRVTPPESFSVGSDMVENGLGQVRPLEVGDILVDEKGGFYKIEAAAEDIYKVTGDIALMQEAVYAFTARGLRVAQTDDGFAVVAIPQFKQLLESVGLIVTEATEPFTPVPLPRHASGCCCGGHGHHHHEGGCGCGGHGHHHHHEDGEGCCCGHHHEDGECGCGGHGHQHHHEEGEGCCCGHHHEEEGCGCGGHGHHHHHEEGEGCCCGHHDHDHDGACGCRGQNAKE